MFEASSQNYQTNEGEKGERNTCVLLVKMKTRRNGKELNDELQLYKQPKTHLTSVRLGK
jgi:hypothetical protein